MSSLELQVALALVELGGESYGMKIRRQVLESAGRDVSIGAVYATLNRLVAKGLATSRIGEATPERGGRPKVYFRLTVTLGEGEDGFVVAASNEIPGCFSQGRTRVKALVNITDAIQSCREVIREDSRLPKTPLPSR